MRFSRREILKGMGAAGLTPFVVSMGCSGDSGSSRPPLPELPEYEWTADPGPETLFEHGVASGDPLSDAVVIWTRISTLEAPAEPPESNDPLEVWWEMSLDEAFEERVAQGTLRTDPGSDFTVKVDVPDLVWGRNYFYRFFAQGRQSPIGRTRLAPKGNEAAKLRFGVCSCANFELGFFYGFQHMASRADLDAVLHLGDYFYEYGNGRYNTDQPSVRPVVPDGDTVTLEDYRMRHAQYRTDPHLQECHRQHPFIVVWDDHESANDAWMDGAENHDEETQGSWEGRLASARQAFFEWIPIRDNPSQQLYRSFKYGELADLIMLDTRIEGRDEQYGIIVFPRDTPGLPENIISGEQEAWLQDQLTKSTAKWKIIGNQVLMGLWQIEDPASGTIAYANDDLWNGYPEGRGRVMNILRDVPNVVVVTGDIHSSWAMDVTVGDGSYDPTTGQGAVAVEFVAPGITSPMDAAEEITDLLRDGSPHIRYAETMKKGYFVLDVQVDKVQSDWYLLDGVGPDDGEEALDASWAVLDGTKHVVERDGPETPNDQAPGLAS